MEWYRSVQKELTIYLGKIEKQAEALYLSMTKISNPFPRGNDVFTKGSCKTMRSTRWTNIKDPPSINPGVRYIYDSQRICEFKRPPYYATRIRESKITIPSRRGRNIRQREFNTPRFGRWFDGQAVGHRPQGFNPDSHHRRIFPLAASAEYL
jgi:hypothetical protein